MIKKLFDACCHVVTLISSNLVIGKMLINKGKINIRKFSDVATIPGC